MKTAKEERKEERRKRTVFRNLGREKKGMSAFSATEHEETSPQSRGAGAGTTERKKQSFGSWMRSRPTYMSFATFFMLFCGGLLTSGLGPALPIIEHQCNTCVALTHLLTHAYPSLTTNL